MYTTTDYRPIEAGVLTVGGNIVRFKRIHLIMSKILNCYIADASAEAIIVPPNTDNITLEFDCTADCLNVINLFTTIL